jgi:hypothetical protein
MSRLFPRANFSGLFNATKGQIPHALQIPKKNFEARIDLARMDRRDLKKGWAMFLEAFGGTLEKVGDPHAQVARVSCQHTIPRIV